MEGKQVTLESLQEQLSKQSEVIATLAKNQDTKATEAPKPPSIPKESVKHKNKEYRWQVAALRFPGSDEIITAEEASTDEKVIAKILAIPGQGLLREQV